MIFIPPQPSLKEITLIRIPRKIIDSFISLAYKSPIEVAGILLGKYRGKETTVQEIIVGRNIENSPVSFTIDPSDIYKAIKTSEEKSLEIIGIIHSHPAPPFPSTKDVEGMKLWPVVWVIVSSLNGSFKAWVKVNGLKEIKVVLTD